MSLKITFELSESDLKHFRKMMQDSKSAMATAPDDEILAATFDRGGLWIVLWAVGLFVALLTAFYMTRLWVVTFFGEPRWSGGTKPHESPWTMTVPLVVLAMFSLTVGWFNTPARLAFEHFLAPSFALIAHPEVPSLRSFYILATLALVIAIAGIVWGWARYHRDDLPVEEGGFWQKGLDAFYVDDFYGRVLVAPGKKISEWFSDTVDPKVLDGAAHGIARGVQSSGTGLGATQTGKVRGYAAVVAVGGILLIIGFLVLGGGI